MKGTSCTKDNGCTYLCVKEKPELLENTKSLGIIMHISI